MGNCMSITIPPPTTTPPLPTITTASPVKSCNGVCGFTQTDHMENANPKNWTNAEAACQAYGSNAHLATLDTQQTGTFIHSDDAPCG